MILFFIPYYWLSWWLKNYGSGFPNSGSGSGGPGIHSSRFKGRQVVIMALLGKSVSQGAKIETTVMVNTGVLME